MSKLASMLGLTSLLLSAAIAASAARIVVNVNANTPKVLVDVNIQDADVSQVLTTLFNSTNGKYQIRIGTGVNSSVSNLQFSQLPFDEAVTKIVTAADPKYTIIKQGDFQYSVSSTEGSGISLPAVRQAVKTSTDDGDEPIQIIKVKLPPVQRDPVTGAMTTPAVTPGGTAPTAEECFLGMLIIKNISVRQLSQEFGYDSIPAFDDNSDDDNYNNNSNNGNYDDDYNNNNGSNRRNRNNRNNNNNDNYNNNYNNNNNNNNNNNYNNNRYR